MNLFVKIPQSQETFAEHFRGTFCEAGMNLFVKIPQSQETFAEHFRGTFCEAGKCFY